jgi:hypothetical protein
MTYPKSPNLDEDTPDQLCARFVAERKRVEGPEDYSCWFDRGWYRTSKGNAYRRVEIEGFLQRLGAKADFDPKQFDEPNASNGPSFSP